MSKKKITVDGIDYVRADSVPSQKAVDTEGLEYSIVRCESAGVFAGFVQDCEGSEATVLKARRLWYWDGAASLSQLAMEGVSKPENCKFPCEVPEIHLRGVIEIIPATEKAMKSIAEVKEWRS